MQAKALAVLRRQTRHVLYTEPSEPQAGKDMTVYYNPDNTCLSGCSDIFITVRTRLIPNCLIAALLMLCHMLSWKAGTFWIVMLCHGMHWVYL